jgi:hypothetical protein
MNVLLVVVGWLGLNEKGRRKEKKGLYRRKAKSRKK